MTSLLRQHARAPRDFDFCAGPKRVASSRSSSISAGSTSTSSSGSYSDVSDIDYLASGPTGTAARQGRRKNAVTEARDYAWRTWISFVGCWGVGVMEPWEACFAILVYATIITLTLFALWQLPSYLAFALHRLAFYLTGDEASLRYKLGHALASLPRKVIAAISTQCGGSSAVAGAQANASLAMSLVKATARVALSESSGSSSSRHLSEVLVAARGGGWQLQGGVADL